MNDIDDHSSAQTGLAVSLSDSGSIPVVATASDSPDDLHLSRSSPGWVTRTVLLALLFVETVVLGFLYVPIPPNPDHEVYDYMAWSALAKGGLYRNGGDMNMPGEAILHIASMKLFGNHFFSYRLLDFLLMVCFTARVALLSKRYYGWIFAGLFFGLYPIVYTTSGYWMTGQRDLLATHAIVLAGFTYLRRVEGGRLIWLIISGIAIAGAVLLKPTYLAFGPILLVLVGLYARRGIRPLCVDLAVLGGVGAAVLGSFLALGWATGSLQDWHEMTFSYSLQNYVGGVSLTKVLYAIAETSFKSWHWYLVMALAGLLCLMIEPRKAPLAVIVAAVATVLVSTFAQRKGFGYHFGGLLSVISLLGAFYLTQIIRLGMRISEPRFRFLVLSFPLMLLFGGLVSKCYTEFKPQARWYLDSSQFLSMLKTRRFDDVFEAARYARSATKPNETIWTYNTHSMINSLADRSFPIRLVAPPLLRARQESPLADDWRHEIEAVFRDQPPEFIVLEVTDFTRPNVFFGFDKVQPYEPVSELREAMTRFYVPDRRIGRFAFFRKDQSKIAEAARTQLGVGTTATSHPQ
jgi:hypothetical protein